MSADSLFGFGESLRVVRFLFFFYWILIFCFFFFFLLTHNFLWAVRGEKKQQTIFFY